jgi:uncharacterized protein YecE (DUF72 family)
MIRVGTAGWTIPKTSAAAFPAEGSTLERYAAVFDAVEINSSFYRPHRPSTYARWAAATPDHFRFSLKLPRTITHEARLVDIAAPLTRFLDEARMLGPKLGVLVIQSPPSLAFDARVAAAFLAVLRDEVDEAAAFEPRHASWFSDEANTLLETYRVARIGADPARVARGSEPGGWRGLTYLRLHGSPRMYASTYDQGYIDTLAAKLKSDPAADAWCMFDNTMLGAAAANGLDLRRRL